jgi:hypothetical protein
MLASMGPEQVVEFMLRRHPDQAWLIPDAEIAPLVAEVQAEGAEDAPSPAWRHSTFG